MTKILNPNKRYVVGFVFSLDCRNVLLIRKNRPVWQAGKLNGIGGEIERNESPAAAMVREFAEECGIILPLKAWSLFASIRDSRGWWVDFFYAKYSEIGDAQSLTDEEVELVPVNQIAQAPCLPNLRWLIPMALSMSSETHGGYEIQERAERAGNQAAASQRGTRGDV
jgi:8-oxo-dGTP diphosphatase